MKKSTQLGLSLIFTTTMISGCATTNKLTNYIDDSKQYDRKTGVKFDTKTGSPATPEMTWQASCLEAKNLEKDLISEAKKGRAEQQTSRIEGKEGVEFFKGATASIVETLKNKATRSTTTVQFENAIDDCMQGIAFTQEKKGGFACEFNQAFNTVTIAGLKGAEGMPVEPKSAQDCVTNKTDKKHLKSIERSSNFKTGAYSPNNPNCKFCK